MRFHVLGENLSRFEILHIPGLSYDGLLGLSPISYAREAIGLGIAAESFGARFFKDGTHLGGVISIPGAPLSDPAFERTQKQFREMYSGLKRSHGVAILEQGASYQALGVSPEEAQFLETRKFQRSEIAAMYRVPLHLINDLDRATFSNIEHQDLGYLQRSLLPWMLRFEQGFMRGLMTTTERRRFFIEHETGSFLRGDTKSRYEAYSLGINAGILTPNEARAKENMNPIEGGDVMRIPLNVTTPGTTKEKEPDARVGPFPAGGERRAAGNDLDAALKHWGLDAAAYEALRSALSGWLDKQVTDVVRLAERVLGVRSGDALTRLLEALNEYYKGLAGVMPESQQAAIREIARTAMQRVNASVGASSGVTDEWLSGYLGRYYSDASERLCSANLAQVERIIAGADGDAVSALRSKLGDWGEQRAEVMARHEAAMALNKTLVAGFKAAGYSSVWKAAPGSCKMCMLMNDQTVTTLTPPLHKGCGCTVDRGAK